MKWSHEGVSLRSPVRSEASLRRLSVVVLVCFAIANLLWFGAISSPPAPAGYAQCLDRSSQGSALCEPLRPSWSSWEFETLGDYAAARACTVAEDRNAIRRMSRVEPARGIDSLRNLEFLRMIRAQQGDCPMPAGEERLVAREYEELRAIEDAVWASRVDRALSSEAAWIDLRRVWHAAGQRWMPLWLPALLVSWVGLLVALRRLRRMAAPFALDVGPSGVRMDGRVIPRQAIAYLSLEGRRLRIERWLGPPVYSRPLPPEALANADEICAALGLWDEDPEPADRRGERRALERLLRTT
jgi:hypothetical protein